MLNQALRQNEKIQKNFSRYCRNYNRQLQLVDSKLQEEKEEKDRIDLWNYENAMIDEGDWQRREQEEEDYFNDEEGTEHEDEESEF